MFGTLVVTHRTTCQYVNKAGCLVECFFYKNVTYMLVVSTLGVLAHFLNRNYFKWILTNFDPFH